MALVRRHWAAMPVPPMPLRARPLALALVAVLTACTGATPDVGATAAPSPTSPAGAPSELTAEEAAVDDALVVAQLEWLLAVAAGEADPLDEAAYGERFTDTFRSQVPLADLVGALGGLRAAGPLQVDREVSRSPYGEVIVVTTGADQSELVITMTVDPDGRIGGLLFSPGAPPALEDAAGSVQEAADRLAALGAAAQEGTAQGRAGLVAGTADGGTCTPTVDLAAEEPIAVGSAAVVWVVGAVVDAIEAGGLRWDTPLVLGAADRSLRSPVLQQRDVPSRLDVEEAVELALLAADHTAIDLLIRAVGRGEVERAQARWGHATPRLNTPFPTTGEVFRLKAASPAIQQRWTDGDEAARRAVLEELDGAELPGSEAFEAGPVAPALGWTAAPADLCRALSLLLDAADREGLEPLGPLLTTEPGVPDPERRWDRIAFVGGGEPGLLSAVWVVEADGDRRALAASLLDPAAAFDEVQTILLLGAARDLLAEPPPRSSD